MWLNQLNTSIPKSLALYGSSRLRKNSLGYQEYSSQREGYHQTESFKASRMFTRSPMPNDSTGFHTKDNQRENLGVPDLTDSFSTHSRGLQLQAMTPQSWIGSHMSLQDLSHLPDLLGQIRPLLSQASMTNPGSNGCRMCLSRRGSLPRAGYYLPFSIRSRARQSEAMTPQSWIGGRRLLIRLKNRALSVSGRIRLSPLHRGTIRQNFTGFRILSSPQEGLRRIGYFPASSIRFRARQPQRLTLQISTGYHGASSLFVDNHRQYCSLMQLRLPRYTSQRHSIGCHAGNNRHEVFYPIDWRSITCRQSFRHSISRRGYSGFPVTGYQQENFRPTDYFLAFLIHSRFQARHLIRNLLTGCHAGNNRREDSRPIDSGISRLLSFKRSIVPRGCNGNRAAEANRRGDYHQMSQALLSLIRQGLSQSFLIRSTFRIRIFALCCKDDWRNRRGQALLWLIRQLRQIRLSKSTEKSLRLDWNVST